MGTQAAMMVASAPLPLPPAPTGLTLVDDLTWYFCTNPGSNLWNAAGDAAWDATPGGYSITGINVVFKLDGVTKVTHSFGTATVSDASGSIATSGASRSLSVEVSYINATGTGPAATVSITQLTPC